MKPKEERVFILYIIIFIIIAFIISNFMFSEKGGITITTHGVEICNENYNCGEADKICPEDYGARCAIKDPDCK